MSVSSRHQLESWKVGKLERSGPGRLTVLQFHTDNKNVGNKDSVENWRSNVETLSCDIQPG